MYLIAGIPIVPAALAVRSVNEIVWTPSVYFFNRWMRETSEWFSRSASVPAREV